MVEIDKDLLNVPQTESIKLTKNSRGYGWDIKILSLDIDALEKINNEMKKRFDHEIDTPYI